MSGSGRPPLTSVLFVCTLNSVRSPIAEGLARQLLDRSVYIDSAGLARAERDAFAIAVLKESGIDLAEDEHRILREVDVEGFDLVVTLSSEAHVVIAERLRATAQHHLNWSIEDPTLAGQTREARLAAYRSVRDRIRGLIKSEIVPLQQRNRPG